MKLHQLPEGFHQTRDALHQIAFFAIAPARYAAVERMGLQAAPGGFGAPKFEGRIARVEGDSIVLEEVDQIATRSITTIRAAAEFFGLDYEVEWFTDFHDPPQPWDPDQRLDVDDAAARALGQWFNFAFDLLTGLHEHGSESDDPSEVQLWPEHFDPATEMGGEKEGERASYGASPGDASHAEPYVYVAPWGEVDGSNPYWNDKSFNGASLPYSAFVSSSEPTATALEFLLEGYRALHSA